MDEKQKPWYERGVMPQVHIAISWGALLTSIYYAVTMTHYIDTSQNTADKRLAMLELLFQQQIMRDERQDQEIMKFEQEEKQSMKELAVKLDRMWEENMRLHSKH
jgi:hypothetical protein